MYQLTISFRGLSPPPLSPPRVCVSGSSSTLTRRTQNSKKTDWQTDNTASKLNNTKCRWKWIHCRVRRFGFRSNNNNNTCEFNGITISVSFVHEIDACRWPGYVILLLLLLLLTVFSANSRYYPYGLKSNARRRVLLTGRSVNRRDEFGRGCGSVFFFFSFDLMSTLNLYAKTNFIGF